MRTPTTTLFKAVKLSKPNGTRTWMIQRRSHGKRERIYFESEREARKEAGDRNRKIESHGTSVKLTPEEQIYASACMADLAKIGRTLREATDYYLVAFSRPPAPTVEELCVKVLTEFRRRAVAGEISEKHEQSMQETIRKLRAQFGSIPIDEITIATVKDWLGTLELAIRTRNRHLGYIYSIFQLASAKEWNMIEKNPLEDVTKFTDPNGKGRKISIFTPEEMQTVLSTVSPDWLPFFALNAFTGLRKAEIERLDWNEVKLDRKLIDLPFWKSKNKKRKLIQVPDNLLSILGPFVKGEGNVKPKRRFEVQLRKLKDTLKMKWPQNVLRHSFCSYSVAIKGLAWTAEQADHLERILKKDYWEVVSPEDAARYWTIVP